MPIGENETKGQYYKRMVADFKMMMEVLEKDAQHLEYKNDQEDRRKNSRKP